MADTDATETRHDATDPDSDATGSGDDATRRDFLTTAQAARELGIGERTVQRWIRAGKLAPVPHPTDSRAHLIRREEVRQLLKVRSLVDPQATDPDRPTTTDDDRRRQEDDPSRPDATAIAQAMAEVMKGFVTHHIEAASYKIGYLESELKGMKALAADNRTLQERAIQAERAAEELRRRLAATEGALEAERGKGFFRRVFNR